MFASRQLATVILAAGKGTRMKNPNKSKVMFELDGKPMIQYVIELALEINSDLVIAVVGYNKQSVIDFIEEEFPDSMGKITFAHQDEQLGTGHAVMQARDILKDFKGDVLILSGDVPLLKPETISEFLEFHYENSNKASMISAYFDDPHGYGRVVRDINMDVTGVVEEKDASEIQKQIKEINSGIYLIDSSELLNALDSLSTDNAQGEYYLTDIFKYLNEKSKKVGAYPVENNIEITGINTIEQLKELEKHLN
ncbi:MAG: NTP transferase domain-containing protein [Ignavibacteriae bacterium]|nr:NTP transferase domain-containing protein [Ignavibacteriota bacterium]MCB0723997.1 NTP transferase domain-containing protein [Ignavibacteriota bacterium]MCB9243959.1 NTP transferase domain-containing protein [Ignavibacteriales bacterium]